MVAVDVVALGVWAVEGDGGVGDVQVLDLDAGAGVKAALAQGVYDFGDAACGGLEHEPGDAAVLFFVGVVVGKTPDATSGAEESVPVVGGEGAAFGASAYAVVDFDAGVALPCVQLFVGAVVEVFFPVGMVDDAESAIVFDSVEDVLSVFFGVDATVCVDVQNVGAVCGDFVSGDERHALWVVVDGLGEVIVVA